MFLFLSKLLPTFVFPPGFQIVLLVVAFVLLRRARRVALGLAIFSIASLYLVSTLAVSETLMGSVESYYPEVLPQEAPSGDAIVVLGDFLGAPTDQRRAFALTQETDRLRTGKLLFEAKKAPFILLSGGDVPVYGRPRVSQTLLAGKLLEEWGVPADAIEAEDNSRNTFENAAFSKVILEEHGVHKILLVTSAFHMPRAAAIFRRLGFQVIPVPCDYRTGWLEPVFPLSWVPEARNLFVTELALHEWLGLAVYKLRGWA